jgi:saccharopine dehydrogenase-like NADP-dependent oxidoreductase
MRKIIILGAGMVGRAMAIDMSKKHYVKSVDLNRNALDLLKERPNIQTGILDVTDRLLWPQQLGF